MKLTDITGNLFKKGKEKEGLDVVKITIPGREPISIIYQDGDTVQSVLDRAKVTVNKDDSCALGRQRIEDPSTVMVKPGDTIVISSKVNNG